jgi:glycosyltransferase involved in cell wall biosynthesis
VHVLIAAHDFYPDPGSGGTGRYVAATARHLVDRGHNVSVVTRRRGGVPPSETVDGIDVYRYRLRVAGRSLPRILRDLPSAATAVADHVTAATASADAPDLLSLQGPVTGTLVERMVPGNVPRVVTMHSPWPTEYRLRSRGATGTGDLRRYANISLRRHVEGHLLARSDRIVTLSEYMRSVTRRVYDHDLTTNVIPGGVDATRFRPDGPTHGRIEGDPAFLTVRRLCERMGHDRLLRAFASVAEDHSGARLYVAGDGPLRDELKATARSLGIAERTDFLGYVPREELPAVYRSADVFVLPTSDLEGFGLATLEALASGLPVVATPVGGTVEVFSDLATEPEMPASPLVDDATPASLADGLDTWASVSSDGYARAGRRCQRYAKRRYPWPRTVSRLEALYDDLRGVVEPPVPAL